MNETVNNETVVLVNDNIPKLLPKEIKRNKLASPHRRVIPSYAYSPKPKPLSRRDKWRMEVRERKVLNQ